MNPIRPIQRIFTPDGSCPGADQGCRRMSGRGFSLVELLVVIAVIGLLASLIVGVGGVAARKSKESRIRGDLNRLVTAIENYKSRLGFYPPCNELNDPALRPPPMNQLFYELSGTVFTSPPGQSQSGWFTALSRNRQDPNSQFNASSIVGIFGTDGFANSARDSRDVKIKTEFKPSEVQTVTHPATGKAVEILVASVPPPRTPASGTVVFANLNGTTYYPWQYDSVSNQRINSESYDLWTDVEIGGKVIRFSNWESQPVVIGP